MRTTRRPTGTSGLSASAETLCVAPDRIASLWPYVSEWLEAACNRCGDWTLAALRQCLDAEQMLLWIVWDGEKLCSATVTELVIVPKGKICRVVVHGGAEVRWLAAIKPIERYAREAGCVAMRVDGRKGWARVLSDYEQTWITLEKRLA